MPRGTPPKPDAAGNIRYSIILNKAAHDRLTAITAKHKISQADAIATLLINAKDREWDPLFDAARNAKVSARDRKKQLLAKLDDLSPEKLAALIAQANKK